MPAGNLTGVLSKIMLHRKCDPFVFFWCTLPLRENVKGLEVKELLNFLIEGFFPFSLSILPLGCCVELEYQTDI